MSDPQQSKVVSVVAPKFTTDNLAESGLLARDFDLVAGDATPAIQPFTETYKPKGQFGGAPLQLHGYSIAYPAPMHDGYIQGFAVKRFANHPEHKYEGPSGQQQLYWATSFDIWIAANVKFLVEGEKKALAFRKYLQAAAIGIRGCWGWVEDGKMISGLLDSIKKGDIVYICMDGDFLTNRGIGQATGTLARQIMARGATPVIPVFPAAYPSGKRMGADDWIMQSPDRRKAALCASFDELPQYDWRDLPEAASFATKRMKLMTTTDRQGNEVPIRNEENTIALVKDIFGAEALFTDQYRGPMFAPWDKEPKTYTDDTLDSELFRYIERVFGNWSKDAFRSVRRAMIGTIKRNLLGERLAAIQWDGKPRIEMALHTHFAAPDTPYTRKVSKGYFLGAIARLMTPGVKWDHVLILESGQRKGKSYGLELLHYGYYANIKMEGADALARKCCSVWLACCDELDHMNKTGREAFKTWVSERVENWVPKYVEYAKETPRAFVMAGTTNERQYLNDPTGAQRFWPVRLEGEVDHEAIKRDRDQLWSEAYHIYTHAPADWWAEFENDAVGAWDEQAEREMDDPLASLIRAALATHNLPRLIEPAGYKYVTFHWLNTITQNSNVPAAKKTQFAIVDACKRVGLVKRRIRQAHICPVSLAEPCRVGSTITNLSDHFEMDHVPPQPNLYVLDPNAGA